MKLTRLIPLLLTLISTLVWAGPREDAAWKQIGEGAMIVDVRTPQEFAAGHLPGAINIPYQVVVDGFTQLDVPRDRQVVLYCRSGRRSAIADQSLKSAGYGNTFNGGGYQPLMLSAPDR